MDSAAERLLTDAELHGVEPLDAEGVLWVAAIDRVPIEERIAWVAEMKTRVEQINAIRAGEVLDV